MNKSFPKTAMKLGQWCAKATVLAAISAGAQLACAAESCDKLDGCAAKACRIDARIAEVKTGGNARLLPALERSRTEMAHCSDDGLKQKRKVALEQAQRRIDRAEADLKQAQAKNEPKKIKSTHKRLENARHAFDEIQSSPL